MRQPLTAPDRLGLLLDWLNGKPLTDADIRRQLDAFLLSFDEASEHSGYLRIVQASSARSLDAPALVRLRTDLQRVLRSGFPLDAQGNRTTTERTWAIRLRPFQLSFGTVRISDEAPIVKPSRATKRQRDAPGAYELLVQGSLENVVPYLVMHLLTAPEAVAIARCPAPAPSDWEQRCCRFLIRTSGGHPREFCSEACRVRSHAERLRKVEEAATGRTRRRKKS